MTYSVDLVIRCLDGFLENIAVERATLINHCSLIFPFGLFVAHPEEAFELVEHVVVDQHGFVQRWVVGWWHTVAARHS
jgi:hypothetical protein